MWRNAWRVWRQSKVNIIYNYYPFLKNSGLRQKLQIYQTRTFDTTLEWTEHVLGYSEISWIEISRRFLKYSSMRKKGKITPQFYVYLKCLGSILAHVSLWGRCWCGTWFLWSWEFYYCWLISKVGAPFIIDLCFMTITDIGRI